MSVPGILLMFAGYTLIYAATARGGVYATEPWNGVLYDAYDLGIGSSVGSEAGAITAQMQAQQRYQGFTG